MYNSWGWGGYLGYMLYPDYKIFLDGRYIFHRYLDNEVLSVHYPDRWQKLAMEHGIELAVIVRPQDFRVFVTKKPDGNEIIHFAEPEHSAVFPIEEWAMVYWDAQALIFVKRDIPDKKWIQEHEFRILRAGELPKVSIRVWQGNSSLSEIKKIQQELVRYLKGPHGKGRFNSGYRVSEWYRHLPGMPRGENP
jgi:hypothetical protein